MDHRLGHTVLHRCVPACLYCRTGEKHSILSPAVGYRVSAGRGRIFYAPDLIFIHERKAALDGVQLYIGDGATVMRSFVRRRGKALIGHSPVRTQLTWCQKEGVPRAIITHCGSEIVNGDEREIAALGGSILSS